MKILSYENSKPKISRKLIFRIENILQSNPWFWWYRRWNYEICVFSVGRNRFPQWEIQPELSDEIFFIKKVDNYFNGCKYEFLNWKINIFKTLWMRHRSCYTKNEEYIKIYRTLLLNNQKHIYFRDHLKNVIVKLPPLTSMWCRICKNLSLNSFPYIARICAWWDTLYTYKKY